MTTKDLHIIQWVYDRIDMNLDRFSEDFDLSYHNDEGVYNWAKRNFEGAPRDIYGKALMAVTKLKVEFGQKRKEEKQMKPIEVETTDLVGKEDKKQSHTKDEIAGLMKKEWEERLSNLKRKLSANNRQIEGINIHNASLQGEIEGIRRAVEDLSTQLLDDQ